jgi:hypothetical protein
MNIYLICSVRESNSVQKIDAEQYVAGLEAQGHRVHFPFRDVTQDDPTGIDICEHHRAAVEWCDEVHVMWDVNSKGSHFDAGMAFMARKPFKVVVAYQDDVPGKSYLKVMRANGVQ